MSSSLKPTASPVDPRLIRIVPTRASVRYSDLRLWSETEWATCTRPRQLCVYKYSECLRTKVRHGVMDDPLRSFRV